MILQQLCKILNTTIYPLKDQIVFFGNIVILGSSLQIEFFFFEIFTQHVNEVFL